MQLLAEEVIEQSSIAAVHESAFGPKQTFQVHAVMSAIGGKADIGWTRLGVRPCWWTVFMRRF
jgi:hypothetical protein